MALRLLLDSGAYEAWRSGKPVDLSSYVRFVRDNEEHIEQVVALDSIPGKPGQPRTTAQVKASAEQGWRNFVHMKSEGVKHPLPVVHQGEDIGYLDRYAAECEWIGLASNRGLHIEDRLDWLHRNFDRLCARGEFPRLRVHGFSESHPKIMFAFPWYSIDSTTWRKCGVLSQAFLPEWDRQNYGLLFFGPFKGGTRHATRGYAAQSAPTQEHLRRQVEACGFTIDQLNLDTHFYRSAFNARVTVRLLRDHPLPPFVRASDVLFGSAPAVSRPLNDRVRFYFATTYDPPGTDPLDYVCIRNRLLSFGDALRRVDLGAYVRARPRPTLGPADGR